MGGEEVHRVAVRGVKLPQDPSTRFLSAECQQECPKPSVSVHYDAKRCEGAASLTALICASTKKNAIMLENPFLLLCLMDLAAAEDTKQDCTSHVPQNEWGTWINSKDLELNDHSKWKGIGWLKWISDNAVAFTESWNVAVR